MQRFYQTTGRQSIEYLFGVDVLEVGFKEEARILAALHVYMAQIQFVDWPSLGFCHGVHAISCGHGLGGGTLGATCFHADLRFHSDDVHSLSPSLEPFLHCSSSIWVTNAAGLVKKSLLDAVEGQP